PLTILALQIISGGLAPEPKPPIIDPLVYHVSPLGARPLTPPLSLNTFPTYLAASAHVLVLSEDWKAGLAANKAALAFTAIAMRPLIRVFPLFPNTRLYSVVFGPMSLYLSGICEASLTFP